MTAADINRDTLTRFLIRAIGHASAVAIDTEFGLRVVDVEVTDAGNIRVEFDQGSFFFVDVTLFARVQTAPNPTPSEGVRP